MNIELIRARHRDSVAEMRKLIETYAGRETEFSDEDNARFTELETSARADKAEIEKHDLRVRAIESTRTSGESDGFQVRKDMGDPYDLSSLRFDTSANDLRARAITAIEGDEVLPDQYKESSIRNLRSVDKRGELATLILATGAPSYRTGFAKVMAGASWALSTDEQQALQRAQALSNASGGFAVPFTLDPTIILTNDGIFAPVRQMATVKTTTTEDWNGVMSAGATAHWRGEAEEVDDDQITLSQPNVPVRKMDIFCPYSIEIEMDWGQMESELRTAMMDAKDRLEGTTHVTGAGTATVPQGVVTGLTGTASEIAPLVAETFAIGDVYGLRRRLPARYRPSRDVPKWLANVGTYDAIRQFDTGGGGGFWTDMNDGTPDRLLSYQTYESSVMDDAANIAPAAVGTHRILIVGDWKAGYYIVDRAGMRVENIPHLFGTGNNRPTGQRGIYAYMRTGAAVVNANALRMLKITTS